MSPRSLVITGANRGIGLGLVRQLLKNQEIEILIATTRNVENSKDLNAIQDPRLHVLPLETTNDLSIDAFVAKVDGIVGDNGLNLLINNAGVLLPYENISRSLIDEQLSVNTTSTVILTQKLLPLLKRASSKFPDDATLSPSRSAIINISSLLGSIARNDSGSHVYSVLAYRMSKAALNQFTKTLSIDLKPHNILVVSFCPGWVKTDLGGQEAFFTVEQSTTDLASSFGKLGETHNGGFFSKTLEPIDW